ncbi:hypothetical protein [Klebsiella sp. 141130]|uniref:hypothetical protein n=1 Tax=Klebsiella TaxID=570 RepID=UPI00277C195D|nr:hypothetical protein [Klebsiella aerogenes]ELY3083838.1 hypothetical protein [Klebsiella aerogenes]HDS7116944.1 hypothetical protein [Klebsiella aerogenes]HDT5515937.1 hypothetical protein [Klebsiella aerogenes]
MSDITKTHQIMHIHLSSWRYFAALTLPPLVLLFNLLFSLDCVLLMGLFLLTHYYCWRIWLDERLFQLIESESDLAEFDNGMAHLWAKKTGNTRTLAERWRGARNLFYRAMFSLMALWVASLCTVLYQSFTLVD